MVRFVQEICRLLLEYGQREAGLDQMHRSWPREPTIIPRTAQPRAGLALTNCASRPSMMDGEGLEAQPDQGDDDRVRGIGDSRMNGQHGYPHRPQYTTSTTVPAWARNLFVGLGAHISSTGLWLIVIAGHDPEIQDIRAFSVRSAQVKNQLSLVAGEASGIESEERAGSSNQARCNNSTQMAGKAANNDSSLALGSPE